MAPNLDSSGKLAFSMLRVDRNGRSAFSERRLEDGHILLDGAVAYANAGGHDRTKFNNELWAHQI